MVVILLMKTIVNIMVICGSLIMIYNIYRYISFTKELKDVMTGEELKNNLLIKIAFYLLDFFLLGYIGTIIFDKLDILIAGILLGGSIFVSLVLTLMRQLVDTVKDRSMQISEVLIGVIEARDPNLNGHSEYVKNLTMLIYKYLPHNLKIKINPLSLQYAALLHDLGKLGVPEAILNKEGKLSSKEMEIMKRHPEIAVQILKPLNNFAQIKEWILFHHERVDGKGYYGVADKNIPLAAKIISVADTYSVITMRRSYKSPKSYEEAIEIMRISSNTQLDKEIVKIFMSIPKNEVVKCAPKSVDINATCYLSNIS